MCKEEKMDEAPSTSKFAAVAAPCRKWRSLSLNPKFNRPINERIAQGNQRDKSLVLRETNTNVTSGFQKVSGERPELGEGKNEVSAGFQTANGKKIFISEESKRSVQSILKEFQGNLHEKYYESVLKDTKAEILIKRTFGKTANSSAQIAKKTYLQAMCKEEKMDEAPSTSKFAAVAAPCRKWRSLSLNPKFNRPINERIAQGNQRDKSLVLRETNINVTSGFQKISGERPELGEGKNEVSAGFQTANGKKIFISEESKRSVQSILKEFQGNLHEKYYESVLKDTKAEILIKRTFGKTANSSAQIAKKTYLHAMCKEEKMDEAPSTSKFAAVAAPCRKWRSLSLNPKFNRPINERIAQGNQRDKSLVLRETNTNVTSGFQKVSGERPELGKGKNEVSAGFQTANGKKIFISEESKRSVQSILKEFQGNLHEKYYESLLKDTKAEILIKRTFGKTANSNAQIAKKTYLQAMCKEEKMDEAPSTSKFAAVAAPCRKWRSLSLNPKFNRPINERIAQGNQRDKSLVLRETNTNVTSGFQKVSGERPELGEGKNEVSAGFQTANDKKIFISEESKRSVQSILKEFQGNLHEKYYEFTKRHKS
ncbi:uncharacterized protein ACN2A1_008374 [Glossina fuscipes fuscipes]